MNIGKNSWSVAIFAARETPEVLKATLSAVQSATRQPTTIDVLVNGNRLLAEQSRVSIRELSKRTSLATFRLWFIPLGDKANAWNQYLHFIWPGEGLAYNVDGYARPNPDALELIDHGLRKLPTALAASGVPNVGRTSKKLRQEQILSNGIHGNLLCLCPDTMQSLRSMGFVLPLGIYRTDSTIGAVIKFSLDPAKYNWEQERVLVEKLASWQTDKKNWWKYTELKGQFKRFVRQAQGNLENRAVRHHLSVCRRAPQEMPLTAIELITIWQNENPVEAANLLKNPLCKYALRLIQKPRDWSLAKVPPELLDF
jgi:hypothetical protein